MLVAVVHFSVGAAPGAVFHVLVNRFVPDRAGAADRARRRSTGSLMWIVNFYVVIVVAAAACWSGEAYVLELMPVVGRGAHARRLRPDARRAPAARALRAVPAGGRMMRVVRSLLVLRAARAAPRAGARRADARSRREGAQVYARYCVGCHGVERRRHRARRPTMLIVKPRDFTKGIFKFRSTPSGTLPTDEDLYRIITRGVYRTSMPDWSLLARARALGAGRVRQGLLSRVERARRRRRRSSSRSRRRRSARRESVARGRELYEHARVQRLPRRRRPRRRAVGGDAARPTSGAIRSSRSTSPRAG